MVAFNVFELKTLMIPPSCHHYTNDGSWQDAAAAARHGSSTSLSWRTIRRQMVTATCNNVVANFSNYGLKAVFTGDAYPLPALLSRHYCARYGLGSCLRGTHDGGSSGKKPSLIDWKFQNDSLSQFMWKIMHLEYST